MEKISKKKTVEFIVAALSEVLMKGVSMLTSKNKMAEQTKKTTINVAYLLLFIKFKNNERRFSASMKDYKSVSLF